MPQYGIKIIKPSLTDYSFNSNPIKTPRGWELWWGANIPRLYATLNSAYVIREDCNRTWPEYQYIVEEYSNAQSNCIAIGGLCSYFHN